MRQRLPFGSLWLECYTSFEEYLGVLPGAKPVKPHRAQYSVIFLDGVPIVPFPLSKSLADIPARPQLRSGICHFLRQGVRPTQPPPALFDIDDHGAYVPTQRSGEYEPVRPSVVPLTTAVVLVGYVSNADSPELLGAWRGSPAAISESGLVDWSPEVLWLAPIEVPVDRTLQAVPEQGGRTPAFDEGIVPALDLTPRVRPADVPPPPDRSADETDTDKAQNDDD
ncbi:hypothetical protein ACIGG9_29155 [Pseudonocardia alni]|uniref:hypothetical protein n=1 Tax=Pseudonocardia alni TaxID=33907 RepID=UPI0033F359B8